MCHEGRFDSTIQYRTALRSQGVSICCQQDRQTGTMRTGNISRQVLGNSLVVSSPQVDVLAGFLNVSPQKLKLTLLFSSEASGWTPSAFHTSCDQKGPTITLVRCGKQYYGGYASVSWNSSNQWLADPRAFLFRFKCDSR